MSDCIVDECLKPAVHSSGICPMHRTRLRRHGSIEGLRPYVAPAERFVRYSPNRPENGCWIWTGNRTADGYGTLRCGGATVYAHRYSYEQSRGPIAEGLIVRHACDNPPCVNPSHLSVGTARDNVNDKLERGRQPRGEGHCCARLTNDEVANIRSRVAVRRVNVAALAREFGVSRSTIQDIIDGRTWRHLLAAAQS